MHFRTEGMVAAAPVSAELWQSRHCNPSAICCLCEYAIGCMEGPAPAFPPNKQRIHTFVCNCFTHHPNARTVYHRRAHINERLHVRFGVGNARAEISSSKLWQDHSEHTN